MMNLIERLQRRFFGGPSSLPAAENAPASRDQHFAHRLQAGGGARLRLPETQGGHIGPQPLVPIPFRLAADDGEVRVAVFADPPGLLTIEVEKPDGTRLAADDGSGQGLSLARCDAWTWCGFRLADPREAGQWRLVLRVDTRLFRAYLLTVRQRFPREFTRLAAEGVYYSVSVLASPRPASPASHSTLAARAAPAPQRSEPRREPGRSPWAAGHPAL